MSTLTAPLRAAWDFAVCRTSKYTAQSRSNRHVALAAGPQQARSCVFVPKWGMSANPACCRAFARSA